MESVRQTDRSSSGGQQGRCGFAPSPDSITIQNAIDAIHSQNQLYPSPDNSLKDQQGTDSMNLHSTGVEFTNLIVATPGPSDEMRGTGTEQHI